MTPIRQLFSFLFFLASLIPLGVAIAVVWVMLWAYGVIQGSVKDENEATRYVERNWS